MRARWMQKDQRLMAIGFFLVGTMVLIAIFAPWLATQDPLQMSLTERFATPTWQHPFGLDQNGSDVFAMVVYGARVSLFVALTVVSISLITGLLIGSLAGYLGGWTDLIIMRVIDMLFAFPGFLLALTLVAVLGPSIQNLILAMCLTSWTGYARLVRAEILHLKQAEFIQGAVAIGCRPWRQMLFHFWPNIMGPLVIQATFGMAGTIISESGLSFLGLGAPPETPTWGALLNSGQKILVEAPHVSFFPGIAILILVLGFNLFGDGLRDTLDPKKNHI